MSTNLLQQGIEAFRSGEKDRAFVIFSEVVKQSPNSALAWFWLGKTVDDPERKKSCFDRALEIDPDLRSKLFPAKQKILINQPLSSEEPDSESVTPARNIIRRKYYLYGVIGVCLLMACITLGVIGMDKDRGNQLVQILPNPQKAKTLSITKTPVTRISPTLTPLPSITQMPTQTNTPEPSATLTTDPTGIYESLGFQVTAARLALDKKQNEECIQYYDRLLDAMPNWTSGFYNRGVCKDRSALKSHDLETFKDIMAGALKDVDKAIALGPVKGKYFAERGYIYRNIQEVLENSSSEQAALNIALENIQTGIKLGDEPNLQADLPSFLQETGHCQESVDLAKQLLETGNYDPNITVLLYDSIATGHLCLGEYSQAKPVMEKRMQMAADCDAYSLQSSILIGLGEQDQAFEGIDRCITDSPNFGGYRYYLRSLIHWDRGEKDLARQDLQTGAGNTWSHGGLCAYIAGLVALDDGDQDAGTELLKYAESTFKNREGLWVRERIRSSLASLNIPQQDPTPVVTFQVTPIIFQQLTPAAPVPQSANLVVTATDVPDQNVAVDTTSPVPAGYEDAILVDFNVGTGPLVLAAGDNPLFHFRPSFPISVKLAREIHFYMAPEGKDPSPIQVYLWTKDGGWRMIKPHWGDNLVDIPSFYISATGDTYLAIRNYSSNTTVRIENASLLVTAELTNSDLKTYGIGK